MLFQSTKILACDFYLEWESKLCKSPCLSTSTCLLLLYIRSPLLVYTYITLPNANTLIWAVIETGLIKWDSVFQKLIRLLKLHSVGSWSQNFSQGLVCCRYHNDCTLFRLTHSVQNCYSYSNFIFLLYVLKQKHVIVMLTPFLYTLLILEKWKPRDYVHSRCLFWQRSL